MQIEKISNKKLIERLKEKCEKWWDNLSPQEKENWVFEKWKEECEEL